MPSRRVFLGASTLLLMAAGPVLSLETTDTARREAFLAWPGGAVFTCPAARARLIAVLEMGALSLPKPMAVIGFAADLPEGRQDLLAFVDAGGVLRALEIGAWRGADGTVLTTRAVMLPDRRHIALERQAARRDIVWRRESWTDYLRAEGDDLVDAPQHAVPEGTWQHALIAGRLAMADRLRLPCHAVTADLLESMRVMTPG
jgi:hypothetical protein